MTDEAAADIVRGVKTLLGSWHATEADAIKFVSVALREARIKEQDRCCKLVYGHAGSDNVAERTVRAIRSGVDP